MCTRVDRSRSPAPPVGLAGVFLPVCSTCGQQARSEDTYRPDDAPATLWWRRKGPNKETGARDLEQGQECGWCGVTRGKNFGNISQQKLNEMLDKDEDLKAIWSQHRTCNCAPMAPGQRQRRYEKVDLSTYRSEETFVEFSNTGTVHTIPDFLIMKGLCPEEIGTAGQQREFVEKELKMTVVMDQGQPVVAVVGPRQIKIGGRQAAGKRKEEQHDDGRAANLGYNSAAQDINVFQQALKQESEVDELVVRAKRKMEGQGVGDDGSTVSGAEPTDEDGDADMSFTSLSSGPSSGFGSVQTEVPQNNRRGRKKQEPSQGSGRKKEEPSQGSQKPQKEMLPPSLPKLKPTEEEKPKPVNKEIQKAEKVFTAKDALLNDRVMWTNRPKHRSMLSAAQALENTASGLLGLPEAEDLMKAMLTQSEMAPKKWDLFGRLRSDCKAFIKAAMSQDDIDILATVSADVYESIITFVAMNLLKDLEQDKENGALLLKLACLSNADSLTLFQYAVAASNDTTKFKSGVQMQMHLLSMLYDKLWRIKQEQAIKEVLAVLEVPAVDLMQLPADYKPDLTVRPDGYTHQMLFDVAALRILATDFKDSAECSIGQVRGSTGAREEGSGGTPMDNYQARQLLQRKQMLSDKLQTHIRLGVAKQTWMGKVERAAQNCVSISDIRKFEFPTFEPTDYVSYMQCMADNDLVDRLVQALILGNQLPDTAVERHDETVQGFANHWSAVKALVQKLGVASVNCLHLEFKKDGYLLTKGGLLQDGRIIRNLCRLKKAAKVQGYMELPEKVAEAWVAAAVDALKLLEAERQVEEGVTLESFKEACGLLSKFSNNKNVEVLFNFVTDSQADLNLANLGLQKCHKEIQGLADRMNALPIAWCQTLCGMGLLSELLALEASTKASFGREVDKQLRLAQVVQYLEGPEDQQPAWLQGTAIDVKAGIKQHVAALLDVVGASPHEALCSEDSLRAARKTLADKLIGVMDKLAKNLEQKKVMAKPMCVKLQPLRAAAVKGDTAIATPILKAFNAEPDKEATREVTQGLPDMMEDEKTAQAVLQWTNDLSKVCGLASPCSTLSACLADFPTVETISTCIWVGMAADYLFKPMDMDDTQEKLEEAVSQMQQFVKSGHTIVRMNKKDLPADVMSKVEKLLKEIKIKLKQFGKEQQVPPVFTGKRASFDALKKDLDLADAPQEIYRQYSSHCLEMYGEAWMSALSPREMEQIDLLWHAMKDGAEHDAVTDVSKSLSRNAIRFDGKHGFDIEMLTFRGSEGLYRTLAGNAMSPPVIGAVLCAALMVTGIREQFAIPKLPGPNSRSNPLFSKLLCEQALGQMLGFSPEDLLLLAWGAAASALNFRLSLQIVEETTRRLADDATFGVDPQAGLKVQVWASHFAGVAGAGFRAAVATQLRRSHYNRRFLRGSGSLAWDALVRRYGYSTADATTIWGNGFQILVMGTALTSPMLDVIGPRWFAAIGLSSECVGLGVLAHTASYDHAVLILSFAYGLVGLGGNMLMLSSMPFCQLFRRSSTAASIMMGAYQAAGFVFMLLTLEAFDFWTFFSTYQLIAGVGLLASFFAFPDTPFSCPE
ncbi:unnamed protein product, partial [Symbiodinium microadriaticum]